MKKRVGVIFGGRSGEHEISIRSATTVLQEIDRKKYEAIPIAITSEGKWLDPGESVELLPEQLRQAFGENRYQANGGRLAMLGDCPGSSFAILPHSEKPVHHLDLHVA